MITLPYEVANLIALRKFHPVTAWRSYYRISEAELAKLMSCSVEDIEALEQSNQHLEQPYLNRLCSLFNIVPEALAIAKPWTNHTEIKSTKAFISTLKHKKRF